MTDHTRQIDALTSAFISAGHSPASARRKAIAACRDQDTLRDKEIAGTEGRDEQGETAA